MRFVAGDGYMIEVPHEILAARDIIFAYEIDGKPLAEKAKPIRAVLPEERAMYWVRNLKTVEILEDRPAQALDKLLFIESAAASLEQHDYAYYESLDKAVLGSDLFAGETLNGPVDTVRLKPGDGLEKNEKTEVFKQGYLKITGEEIPAFVSPDIPKGMHVKDILWLSCADVGYFSVEEGYSYFTSKQLEDKKGIAVA